MPIDRAARGGRWLAAALGILLALPAARADDTAAAPAGGLTLEVAIDQALAHNERALKAPQRIAIAAGGVERARSAFLPSLVAQAQGAASGPADRNGRYFSGSGSATLNQPIVNASAFPLYGQAKHNLAAERFGAAEDVRVLSFDTSSAFLSALTADQLLVAAQGRLQRAQADADDTGARAQAGLSSTNDVTRAAIAVATAQSQVANATGNQQRAHLQLAYLVGQPISGPLVPPDATTDRAKKNVWEPEEMQRRAEGRRPDVLAAAEHTLSLREAAKEPLYRLIPTLGLSAQLREIFDPAPLETAGSASAQLTLTWTLYDAGVRYADRRVRLAQAESAALDERALRRSVATDIAVAVAELRAARSIYQISQQAVAAARKNTDETEILYKQGLAKAIELTDANASRYDAEVTLAQAKLGMEQAYLNLRFALGLGPVSDEAARASAAGRGAH
jgi:outer membrane protein TolC